MPEPTVLRQYPYRSSLIGTAVIAALSFVLVFGVRPMLSDDKDFLINGCIPVTGRAATALRWVMAASSVVFFALAQMLFWHRVLWPARRIAFTTDGILLPRHRLAVREDFVPYGDIERVWLETYGDKVTCLNFQSRRGKFCIMKVQLQKSDFKEVVSFFFQLCNEAKRPSCSATAERVPQTD